MNIKLMLSITNEHFICLSNGASQKGNNNVEFPKIYLAVDNCFASKRWTIPADWIRIIKEAGINCIEASVDNECDPLYSDSSYIKDWINDVQKESENQGVEVTNIYSGHGTYSTLGLSHTDKRCRDKFLNKWMYAFIDNASLLGVNVGFFCHAFDESVLQNPLLYQNYLDDLLERFCRISEHASNKNVIASVEQMYTPHQYPWRINDCYNLMEKINKGGNPFYITIDVGHQYGQKKFLKPTVETLTRAIEEGNPIYTGSYDSYKKQCSAINGECNKAVAITNIIKDCDDYPHLFATCEDSDIYQWLSKLGCYSPIIHLQQTDNTSSSHKDFIDSNNEEGIINGEAVLNAIYDSYMSPVKSGMPPRVDKIYLTMEVFYGTAEYNYTILNRFFESAAYWRKFIPEDGIGLDKLVQILNTDKSNELPFIQNFKH